MMMASCSISHVVVFKIMCSEQNGLLALRPKPGEYLAKFVEKAGSKALVYSGCQLFSSKKRRPRIIFL